MDMVKLPIPYRRWSGRWFAAHLLSWSNKLRRAVVKPQAALPTSSIELREIRELASKRSDINEHLETIFAEGLLCRPRLIVELGVRGGDSSFVFDRVARLCRATVVGVDIDDCSKVYAGEGRFFFQGDDVTFASHFAEFCSQKCIGSSVDLLFVDTSHYYEHTVQEIANWFPLLSPWAKVMFHDTNVRPSGRRKDGSFEVGWDNQRGVIRAIEQYLGININENREYLGLSGGYLIRHWPHCNGLTIIDRLLCKQGRVEHDDVGSARESGWTVRAAIGQR
jgi:cephalosporin hydroxylase